MCTASDEVTIVCCIACSMQAVQLQELESMRAELTVAYDANADLRDRLHALQQQIAAMRAEAAARTPVGVTVEKVRQCWGAGLCQLESCLLLASCPAAGS